MEVKLPGRYALALALVLVLLIICVATHAGDATRHLPGFWTGETNFLVEGGLENMFLQIEPSSSSLFDRVLGRAKFEAFLFMSTDAGIICNQPITISASFGYGFRRRDEYNCKGRIAPDDLDECPLIPETWDGSKYPVNLTFSPTKGTLALHDKDRLLAYFVKDSETTAALGAPPPDEK